MAKDRKNEGELRQMMLEAARMHKECGELEDLFHFGPTPRAATNWGFGIAGKDNNPWPVTRASTRSPATCR